MLDFAGSELLLIGVVSLILIGPKDMPTAIRTVTGFIKKARKMASEFQSHIDEMVKEADLQEARDEFRAMRRMNLKSQIMNVVDKDGQLQQTFADDPLPHNTIHTSSASSLQNHQGTSTSSVFSKQLGNESLIGRVSEDKPSQEESHISPSAIEEEYVPDMYQSEESERAQRQEAEQLAQLDPAPVFLPPSLAFELQRARAAPSPPVFVPPSHFSPYDHNGRSFRKEF